MLKLFFAVRLDVLMSGNVEVLFIFSVLFDNISW